MLRQLVYRADVLVRLRRPASIEFDPLQTARAHLDLLPEPVRELRLRLVELRELGGHLLHRAHYAGVEAAAAFCVNVLGWK